MTKALQDVMPGPRDGTAHRTQALCAGAVGSIPGTSLSHLSLHGLARVTSKQKDTTLLEFEVVVVVIAVKSETEHLKNMSCRSGEIEQGLRCLSCRGTNLVRSSH